MLLSKERCNVWGGGIIYIWTHTYKYYHKPLHSKKSKKKKVSINRGMSSTNSAKCKFREERILLLRVFMKV